ncbi:retrovirus-related pol polyprotein from transposon TNT 1-94 [Tanacetum coccineum]
MLAQHPAADTYSASAKDSHILLFFSTQPTSLVPRPSNKQLEVVFPVQVHPHSQVLNDSKDKFKFFLDTKEFKFSVDDFRRVFQLPQATDNNNAGFVDAQTFTDMLPFFRNELRFSLPLHYAELLWEGLHYLLMHPIGLIPYPRFTKIIVDHFMTENPGIPKRLHEHYHRVANEKIVKSIFNSRKNKEGEGMRIPEWMLREEMKLTRHYQLYISVFRVDALMTQSQLIKSTQGMHRTLNTPMPSNHVASQGESSVTRKPTIIRIPIRHQSDPETLIPIVETRRGVVEVVVVVKVVKEYQECLGVPKVDDVSLVDGVFDGAFGGDEEEDFVMGEGVVVSSSSLDRSTKSCLGGMMFWVWKGLGETKFERTSCTQLEAALKNGERSDIDANELFMELRLLDNFLPSENMGPVDVLTFLKQRDCFPNALIAYRLLSSMSQERLKGLALIAIENGLLSNVDYKEMVKNLALKNARRIARFTQ